MPEEEKNEDSSTNRSPGHPLHGVFPRDTKIGTAIAWWAAAWYVYKQIKSFHAWFKEHLSHREKYSVGLSSWDESELYQVVFNWIAHNVETGQEIDNYTLVSGYHKRKWIVSKGSTGGGSLSMEMAGIPVKIDFSDKEGKEENSTIVTRRRDLVIRCRTQEEIEAIRAFIEELWVKWNRNEMYGEEEEEVAPKFPYSVWTGMHWYTKRFVARPKESVILRAGQNEDLFSDITRFLNLRKEYERVNVPWHRGYLFYGPPGTGKTSLALAVASSFEIPVYSLSLSSLEADKDLLKAIASMDDNEAVLIIEDIDVASVTHTRESDGKKKKSKISLDTLLNILDGAGTPSGLITIMTTNYKERLDDALIRPGRVDYELLVDVVDDDQAHRMVEWYTGIREFKLPKIESTLTPAEITGAVKSFIGHPDLCIAEVSALIEAKNEH